MLGHETRDEALADTVAEEEASLLPGSGRFTRKEQPARAPVTTT